MLNPNTFPEFLSVNPIFKCHSYDILILKNSIGKFARSIGHKERSDGR